MEKFFTPVHSPPAQDETKPRKHHHHHHHPHEQPPHQHHHYHQDRETHSYTKLDEKERDIGESHGHHRQHHDHRFYDDPPHHDRHHPHHHQHHHRHHHHPPHHREGDEMEMYDHLLTPITLSRASSSSLSSSSSSSSATSWFTEASANDPFSLRHAERPLHSLSCSDIVQVHGGFREDDGSEPIVYATVKHERPGDTHDQVCGRSQWEGKPPVGFSGLHRGHSRSEEGLPQTRDNEQGGGQDRDPPQDHGRLFKTASLGRSLAFSEENIMLGVSASPKRAVSSSQLPSKGILKNREPPLDIRKAKSMEVLSPRVAKGDGQGGGKGKGTTQAELEKAEERFVQGKVQFSAFLDEITKQVMSPSNLSILGVNNSKTPGRASAPAQASCPIKPQLPPKTQRESSGEEREQRAKQHTTQGKSAHNNPHSYPQKHSNPVNLISYAKNHPGSPSSHHHQHPSALPPHPGGSRDDRRPSPTEGPVAGDRHGRYGAYLTDGTSTSPETILPKQHHHRKHRPTASHNPPSHPCHFSHHHQPQQGYTSAGHQGLAYSPPPPAPAPGQGPESESPSSKSDSSRTRDTASTSQGLEQSDRHRSRVAHVGCPKQHRDSLCDGDQLQALQEENTDLHQNLLQTVVCIESLELELQRAREELGHVKERYKSLLETQTETRQANDLLGEHLHIASESLSSERKYLMNGMAQLSSELEDAHRTIAALENIDVPCLLKELLEKHFGSTEAIQEFLKTSTAVGQSATSPRPSGQSHDPTVEEIIPLEWLKGSEAGQQRVTAFMPWKQEATGAPATGSADPTSDRRRSSPSPPPFSIADISMAIYRKIAANHVASPSVVHPQPRRPQLSAGTEHRRNDPPQNSPKGYSACDGRGETGGGGEAESERSGVGDVTYLSAQRLLDDFMHQLHPHGEGGGGKGQQQQQQGVERVGGADEERGREAE